MQDSRSEPTILDEKLVTDEDDFESLGLKKEDPRSKFHINNPFKRKKALPPEEVRAGQVIDPVPINSSKPQPAHNYHPWDFKGRIGAFAAEQGEKWREKKRGEEKEKDLPVTIIPAQPRGRTWSPDAALNLPTEVIPRTPSTTGQGTSDGSGPTAVDVSPRAASSPITISPQPHGGLDSPPRTAVNTASPLASNDPAPERPPSQPAQQHR
jgi:hypothetical protein